MTYYIDNINGLTTNDGCSENTPLDSISNISTLSRGDTVLFKRGSFYRSNLETKEGITYGAYGEGEKPTFCGSADLSDVADWIETETPNVWECAKKIDGNVGNFVFTKDGVESFATLRWTTEDLVSQGDFWDSRYGEKPSSHVKTSQTVLLYSIGNPAVVYSHIEGISFFTRNLGILRSHTTFKDLKFMNSGVHGLAGRGENITVQNCDFVNIGGCVWSKELRIRFGNGVELWTHGDNVTVEGCMFKNIYDSCVTHQGPGDQTVTARNFICRNNVFDTYGMAAFEYRDKLPINSCFTNNVCLNAGCGFAMLGEGDPRSSEIWPQPMGHHIFLWRIEKADAESYVEIKNNVFGPAPVGAAIYSIISPDAEARIELDNNVYTPNSRLLIHFGDESFTSLEDYKAKTGKDANSNYIK